MSDHISGPRALSDPIADITDVYAFPSPEDPSRLVLVLDTLPMAKPTDLFSAGLLYRFRLRPLTPHADASQWGFVAGAEELVLDCVFGAPEHDGPDHVQHGTCVAPGGEEVRFRVNDEAGGAAGGVRVFAGVRWDPFIMDARAALATLATHELAFTDHGSIFLDGKNVLSIVIEIDIALLPGGPLVGVVAETLTSGEFNVRIERVGRPEVKNMMLAPREFDPVNRDLEIRDLYNMEDVFNPGESYAGAFRARLDANLAFWDGLDGKQDWPIGDDGRHPLTELVLGDYLVVDTTKAYVEQGSYLEIELAARRGEPHATCGGRTLNDDVMDTIFTQLVNAGLGPTVRDGVDAATHPATTSFPVPRGRQPEPARASRAPLTMDSTTGVTLELDDIQAGALHERPSPYVGTYLLLSIRDRADGRALVRRLHRIVDPATAGRSDDDTSLTVAFTYHGLEALGVPQDSLDRLRPGVPGGHGGSGRDPRRHRCEWSRALGGTARQPRGPCRDRGPLLRRGAAARGGGEGPRGACRLPGVDLIWRQDCYQLATGRTSFGFKDGIGQPTVEGSGRPQTNSKDRPLKAGEIILGYPDETGELPPMPTPDVLGRNGTYVVFRKLHTKVAAYRSYLRERATSRAEEDLLGAKIVGRWQSGAPLATSPDADDVELGSDPRRNNDFGYGDDPRGFKCPVGAHARRANPRDAFDQDGGVEVRLHQMVRRGTSYGPMLPEGVVEDDGVERGIIFVFAGAHLKRQFEFVKTQWLNDGIFIGAPLESDPLVGPRGDDSETFTIPHRPIRRRLTDLPPFVITRGGEYCFAPSLSALRWLSELDT